MERKAGCAGGDRGDCGVGVGGKGEGCMATIGWGIARSSKWRCLSFSYRVHDLSSVTPNSSLFCLSAPEIQKQKNNREEKKEL